MSATIISNTAAVGGPRVVTASWSYIDPYENAAPAYLRHRFFHVQWSLSAVFPDEFANLSARYDTQLQVAVPEGTTVYFRVRSQDAYGTNGAWTATFSDASDGFVDPWAGGWSSFTPTITSQGGSFTLTSSSGHYKQTGRVVLARTQFIFASLSSLTGYVRIAGIPVTLRSGQKCAARGVRITAGAGGIYNLGLAGRVVGVGSNNTAIELRANDGGSFPAVINLHNYGSGMFEAAA